MRAIDDVERGAEDSDWQPAKDAARQIAFAEDGAIFEGYTAAGIVLMALMRFCWGPMRIPRWLKPAIKVIRCWSTSNA
jgi:hypothetical protein